MGGVWWEGFSGRGVVGGVWWEGCGGRGLVGGVLWEGFGYIISLMLSTILWIQLISDKIMGILIEYP